MEAMKTDLCPCPGGSSCRSSTRHTDGSDWGPRTKEAVSRWFSSGAQRHHGSSRARGRGFALALALLMVGALSDGLGKSTAPGAVNSLPASSESAQVKDLQQQFPHSELAPVMAVFTRASGTGLTKADLASVNTVGDRLAAQVGQKASPAIASEDGRAAMVSVLINADRPNGEIATTIKELRSTVSSVAPQAMMVQITGGPAFGADIASAFNGANIKLLAVTIGIVALLLLLTYRSPVLWLVPLTVVGIADQVAGTITGWIGQTWDRSSTRASSACSSSAQARTMRCCSSRAIGRSCGTPTTIVPG